MLQRLLSASLLASALSLFSIAVAVANAGALVGLGPPECKWTLFDPDDPDKGVTCPKDGVCPENEKCKIRKAYIDPDDPTKYVTRCECQKIMPDPNPDDPDTSGGG